MDHATMVNDLGELGIFIDPSPVEPDGYRLEGRNLVILSGRDVIGSYALEDVAFGAASRRPDRTVAVFEMDENAAVVRSSNVRNRGPRR